jgi:hypothetical protein
MWEFGSKVKITQGLYEGSYGVVIVAGRELIQDSRVRLNKVRLYDGHETWVYNEDLRGPSDAEWWGFLDRMEESELPVPGG